MHVVLVSSGVLPVPPPRYGGAEVVIGLLARGLAASGHQVTLFALQGSRPIPGVRLVLFDQADEVGRLYPDILAAADIVHGHVPAGVTWDLARRQGDRDRPRIVHTVHGAALGAPSLPDAVVAVGLSESHALALSAELGRPCPFVYNGIDLEAYPCHTGHRSTRVLYMNRLAPEKGLHLAVEACRRTGVALDVAGTEHLVGDPGYVRTWLGRMDGREVAYHGDLGPAEKLDRLQHARALLWTAPWEEPFGLGVVEAMACGTPVIGLARGALPEIVREGGRLVHSVADLPEAIRLGGLPDPAACRRNAERFSARAMVTSYITLYEGVLAGRYDGGELAEVAGHAAAG